MARDQTPIKHNFRSSRIAGGDRTWFAVRLGFKIRENLSVDLDNTHIFVNDPTFNLTAAGNSFKGYLLGSYDSSFDILSLQVSYKF